MIARQGVYRSNDGGQTAVFHSWTYDSYVQDGEVLGSTGDMLILDTSSDISRAVSGGAQWLKLAKLPVES